MIPRKIVLCIKRSVSIFKSKLISKIPNFSSLPTTYVNGIFALISKNYLLCRYSMIVNACMSVWFIKLADLVIVVRLLLLLTDKRPNTQMFVDAWLTESKINWTRLACYKVENQVKPKIENIIIYIYRIVL